MEKEAFWSLLTTAAIFTTIYGENYKICKGKNAQEMYAQKMYAITFFLDCPLNSVLIMLK